MVRLTILILAFLFGASVTAQPLCTGANCPCIRGFDGECVSFEQDPCFPTFQVDVDQKGNPVCSVFPAWDAKQAESHYRGAYQTIKQLERVLESCRKTRGRRCR